MVSSLLLWCHMSISVSQRDVTPPLFSLLFTWSSLKCWKSSVDRVKCIKPSDPVRYPCGGFSRFVSSDCFVWNVSGTKCILWYLSRKQVDALIMANIQLFSLFLSLFSGPGVGPYCVFFCAWFMYSMAEFYSWINNKTILQKHLQITVNICIACLPRLFYLFSSINKMQPNTGVIISFFQGSDFARKSSTHVTGRMSATVL